MFRKADRERMERIDKNLARVSSSVGLRTDLATVQDILFSLVNRTAEQLERIEHAVRVPESPSAHNSLGLGIPIGESFAQLLTGQSVLCERLDTRAEMLNALMQDTKLIFEMLGQCPSMALFKKLESQLEDIHVANCQPRQSKKSRSGKRRVA